MRYRRNHLAGGTYFFTVNLLERNKTLLTDYIAHLRDAVRRVKQQKPFYIRAYKDIQLLKRKISARVVYKDIQLLKRKISARV